MLGSGRYALLLGELLILSQALLALLARGVAAAAPAFAASCYSACAVGFSGVLFALKVGPLRTGCHRLVCRSSEVLVWQLDKLDLAYSCILHIIPLAGRM